MKRLEDRPWWPDLVSLKDTLSLRELAERFGAAPAAIANALRRNNLDRAPAPPGPRAYRDPSWKAAAEAATAETAAKTEAPAAKPAKTATKAEKAAAKVEAPPAKAGKAAKAAKAPKKVEKAPEVAPPAAPAPEPEVVVAAPAPVAEEVVKAPVVVEAPVLSPSVRQVRGYRAMIDGQGFVIVAGNLADAAAVACAANKGDVVSIELLGLALAI